MSGCERGRPPPSDEKAGRKNVKADVGELSEKVWVDLL